MPDPLTGIDNLVANALTGFAGLTALVPVGNIQVWDREVDIRGEIETATHLAGRCWVVPDRSMTEFDYSSGSVRFTRRYAIGFGVGGLKLEKVREIEYQITLALLWLHSLKQPDGVTPIVHPAPLEIESVSIGGTDTEREPLGDAQEWTDVNDVAVLAFASRAALLA